MMPATKIRRRDFRSVTRRDLSRIAHLQKLDPERLQDMQAVAMVLRFEPTGHLARPIEARLWCDGVFFEPALRQIRRMGCEPTFGHRPARRGKLTIFGHVEWE